MQWIWPERDQEHDSKIFCAFTIPLLPIAKVANAPQDFFIQSIWEVINKQTKDDIYALKAIHI